MVAEKILGEDEPLPRDWMVDGTSGYDFLNACNRLFFSGKTDVEALERVYRDVTGETRDFGTLVRSCKQIIMRTSMASEINTLSHQLDRITERNRKYRDFTLSNLRYALREFIASLAIYRSYTTPDAQVSDRDRQFIELACEQAKLVNQTRRPRTSSISSATRSCCATSTSFLRRTVPAFSTGCCAFSR